MARPRLLFENDSRHTLIYMYEPPIAVDEHESAVDEILGTPVEALLFNLGYGNGFLHATEVGERWGPDAFATEPFRRDGGEQWEHVVFQRAYRNAKQLIDEGHDPLRIVSGRARARGLLLYPTLQVNAAVGDPRLTIGARGGLESDHPAFGLGDFAQREWRDFRFALVEEVLSGYDVAGFELNLNHYAGAHYFHPEQRAAGKALMTEWIARVSEAVRRSGAERELAVRVPTSVDACLSLGCDVEEWARQGLVDLVNAENFALSSRLDVAADFGAMLRATEGSDCRVHGVIRNEIGSDRVGTATIEMIRAAACNYWDQGVEGLSLVHWCGNWPYGATFYEQLRELPFPEVMAAKDKIYALPTAAQRFANPGGDAQLPVGLEPNATAGVLLPVSDDLARWGDAGRVHEVILRIRITRVSERDRFDFRLNGRELPAECLRKIDHVYQMSGPRYRSHSTYWFIFKLGRDHWPVRGSNKVAVTLQHRDAEITPKLELRDVELEIRYLRGKSFHRGEHYTDPDLGPYEHAAI